MEKQQQGGPALPNRGDLYTKLSGFNICVIKEGPLAVYPSISHKQVIHINQYRENMAYLAYRGKKRETETKQ